MKLRRANLVIPVRIEYTISVLAELYRNIDSEVSWIPSASSRARCSLAATCSRNLSIFFLLSLFYNFYYDFISSSESSLLLSLKLLSSPFCRVTNEGILAASLAIYSMTVH